jgi:PAS domain S-box-containing protein
LPNSPLQGTHTLRDSEERFRLLVESVRDYAIFMLDPTGHVISWNPGAERIKGYRADEIIGKHFSIFYPQEQIDRHFPEYELEVARETGRFEDEGWRLRKDGTRFWANVVITALTDHEGNFYGYAKITRDMTERRAQEERLLRSEERFRLLVDGVRDYAIFMLDTNGYVASWNAGAERIKGYRADEIIGKHFSIFYPREQVERGHPEYELKVTRAEGRFEEEGWRVRKDGSLFWANVVITALYDSTGALYGFAKVTRDMTERKRVEALEFAEQRMFEFLAMLSHELRNPLAPISNAIYMLHMKSIDDPEIKWLRDVMERQVGQLTRLVDDLLEVSRVTSGSIRLQREQVDVASVVSQAIESSRPLIESRRHALEISLPATRLTVDGDPARLSQVIVNLLNNAAKYTPEGGRIEVEVGSDGDHAIVKVCDNGVGIPPELMPKIFDLFTQGERTLDRSEGGLGIGLTLVRRLVEMHGGSVDVRSAGADRGSEFAVRLPLVERIAATADSGETTPDAEESRPQRVLIVDDNIDAATSMMMFVRAWGFDVRTAHDGVGAVEAALDYRPDIILLDLGLPQLDGYEVAERIRSVSKLRDTALIAVTGYGREEDRRRTRDAGFLHHFVKPVDPDSLRVLLTTIRDERIRANASRS